MDLSIIIINWNTKDLLQNCLKSVFAAIKKIDFEVLVVDNGSWDGSPEMVRETFPGVKLIQNHRNLGFARANNIAIEGKVQTELKTMVSKLKAQMEEIQSTLNRQM